MLPSPADVEPRGLLGRRLSLCRERQLLTKDEETLLAGFERRPGSHPWIGEHVGKWLDAASTEFTRTGDARLRTKLDRVARRLRATQESDGYLGTYLRAQRWTEWDVWVHKYGLIGLLAHHAATGETASLEAAKRIGALLRTTFAPGLADAGAADRGPDLMSARISTHAGMAAGSVLVGLCRLVRATGDGDLLEFAQQIARRFEAAEGPQLATSLLAGRGVHETANAKAYEMLSCLTGLVDLARLTGEARDDEPALRAVEPALRAVESAVLAFDDVVARQLYVTGGLSFEEFFRAPGTMPSVGDVSETCALVSWMQLCAGLFESTGERRFLEPFERALWNHLLAAQREDGAAFCYFTPLGGPRHHREEVNCCGSSGPRGLSLAPQLFFSIDAGDASDANRSTPRVRVNLLGDARLRTRIGGADVDVTLATRFPAPGTDGAKWSVTIDVKSERAVELAVAIPSWAPRATLRSRSFARSAKGGGTAPDTIVVPLAAGSAATFELELEGVALKRVEGHGREAGRVAFEHGPFVLARPRGGGELVPFHTTSDPARPLEVWQEAPP